MCRGEIAPWLHRPRLYDGRLCTVWGQLPLWSVKISFRHENSLLSWFSRQDKTRGYICPSIPGCHHVNDASAAPSIAQHCGPITITKGGLVKALRCTSQASVAPQRANLICLFRLPYLGGADRRQRCTRFPVSCSRSSHKLCLTQCWHTGKPRSGLRIVISRVRSQGRQVSSFSCQAIPGPVKTRLASSMIRASDGLPSGHQRKRQRLHSSPGTPAHGSHKQHPAARCRLMSCCRELCSAARLRSGQAAAEAGSAPALPARYPAPWADLLCSTSLCGRSARPCAAPACSGEGML